MPGANQLAAPIHFKLQTLQSDAAGHRLGGIALQVGHGETAAMQAHFHLELGDGKELLGPLLGASQHDIGGQLSH
ncbi:hypothetical protein D9M68_966280 [compost metagenome]